MTYDFLVDSYETERLKVVSVWSMFREMDFGVRPHEQDIRGRTPQEHMVHQCVSEDLWFKNMLGIDINAPPLPENEERWEFMKRYAEDSGKRLAALREKPDAWWQEIVDFFGVPRSRAWVMTRRLTHTAHHRGQQLALLRMLGSKIHSTYGPTADTGGLMQDKAPTIYPYATLEELLEAEEDSYAKKKAPLPERSRRAVTERPF